MAAMANLANTMEANAAATLQAVQRLGQPAENGNGNEEGNANDNAEGNGDNTGVGPMTLATFLKAQHVPLNQYVEFAAYQLEGEAQPWWQAECCLLQLQNADIPWEVFQTAFYKKYFPESAREAKEMELMQLKQGSMSVAEYTNKFEELCRFSWIRVFSDLVNNARVVKEYAKTVAASKDTHGGSSSHRHGKYFHPRGQSFKRGRYMPQG
ncbi:hypothetical protein AHAS_Ahas13G0260700 [Arachis hypogaea]